MPQAIIDFYLLAGTGELQLLEPPRPYVFGRDGACDFRIDTTVASRRHCTLRWSDADFWTLEDLESRNGTFVNGTRLATPQPLKDRDRLQIGGQQFTYLMLPAGSDLSQLAQDSREMHKLAETADLSSIPVKRTKAPSLTGEIADGGLGELLRYFNLTKKSGRLLLAESESRQLWIEDGVPRHALLLHLTGADALKQAMAQEACTFAFFEKEKPPMRSIEGDSRQILRELFGIEDLHGLGINVRDIEKAQRLQRHQLGRLPDITGYEIAVYYEGRSGVSGDFYEVGTLPDGSLLMVLGDVSGHGVQAAMVVTGLLKSLRALRKSQTDLLELLVRLNDEAWEDLPRGQFATMFAARLRPATGELVVASAGHHPAFLFSRTSGRAPERFGEAGLALGLATGEEFRASIRLATARMAKGDALVQFTDGLIEAAREGNDIYGMERMSGSVVKHAPLPNMQAFVDSLAADVHAFANDLNDDLTVFALARVDEAPSDRRRKSSRIIRRHSEILNYPAPSPPSEALQPLGQPVPFMSKPTSPPINPGGVTDNYQAVTAVVSRKDPAGGEQTASIPKRTSSPQHVAKPAASRFIAPIVVVVCIAAAAAAWHFLH